MLENIKLLLQIKSEEFDEIITLYLNKVEAIVLEYCNIRELDEALKSFVEDKVVSIMKSKMNGGTENTGEIKSVSRGDTRIEYNVGGVVSETSVNSILTSSDMNFLNNFRRARVF